MASGENGIQKMLIQRLQRQVATLEKEVQALAKQKDELVGSLHQLANESMAKVYLLEEALSEARQQRDTALERVDALERRLAITKSKLATLEAAFLKKRP